MERIAERQEPIVVTLGEIMLRLRAPGREGLFQSNLLEATFGGGEANVAVSLAQWGVAAGFVTALPEGPLGDAALAQLRGLGVDVSSVVRRPVAWDTCHGHGGHSISHAVPRQRASRAELHDDDLRAQGQHSVSSDLGVAVASEIHRLRQATHDGHLVGYRA